MEFKILGPLLVTDGAWSASLGSRKQRCLLALLVLHANRPVSIDRIVDELWPTKPPRSGVANVHAYVSRLRRALDNGRGRATVRRDPDGYVLAADPGDIDVLEFERLMDAGRVAASHADAATAAGLFDEGLGLWRGDFLGELGGERFAQAETARVEQLRLGAIEARFEVLLALGQHALVASEAPSALSNHPHREALRGHVMLGLYRCGRQADALQVYREGRRRLVDELGIEPGPALQQLEQQILLQSAELDWPAARHAERSARQRPTPRARDAASFPAAFSRAGSPFVGRDPQMSTLRAAWQRAVAGERGFVLLSGEPGIGKTRVAAELAAGAGQGDGVVLYGRCYEDSVLPYHPFAEAVRAFATAAPADELARAVNRAGSKIAHLVPELEASAPREAQTSTGRETERYLVFEAGVNFLAALADDAPVLLILDDLHWGDESTWLLLGHLARASAPDRLLILGTSRSTEPTAAGVARNVLAGLRREQLLDELAVEGLGEEAIRALIAARTERRPSAVFCAAVRDHTAGNPLFVEQLLHHVAENSNGVVPVSLDLIGIGIPARAGEVIADRIARLPDAAVGVLAAASVIGVEFFLDILEAVTEVPADDIVEQLDRAVAAGLVLERIDVGHYAFVHGLTRAAVYSSLGHTRRARLHHRVGRAIEEGSGAHAGPHLVLLADHFAASGEDDAKAADYAYRAGMQALTQLAHEQAATLFERALAGLGEDAGRRGCDVLVALAEARRRAGDLAGARSAFDEAAAAALAGNAEQMAAVALANPRGFVATSPDANPALIGLLEAARVGLADDDSDIRARVLARLAVELWYTPDRHRSPGLSEEALAMARRLGDGDTLAHALLARHDALHDPAHVEERLAITTELVDLGVRMRIPEVLAQGRLYRVVDLVELCRPVEADAEMATCERDLSQIHSPLLRLSPLYYYAARASMSGRLDEAERLTLEAFQALQAAGYPDAGQILAIQLYQLRWLQGRLSELEGPLVVQVNEYPNVPAWRAALAHLLVETGRRDEAREHFDVLSAGGFREFPFDNTWTGAMVLLGEVCAALGDERQAEVLYGMVAPFAPRAVVLATVITCSGSLARTAGLLAATMADWSSANRHFETALAVNHSMEAAPFVVLTLRDQARMLRARGEPGDVARADGLHANAREIAASLGMALH